MHGTKLQKYTWGHLRNFWKFVSNTKTKKQTNNNKNYYIIETENVNSNFNIKHFIDSTVSTKSLLSIFKSLSFSSSRKLCVCLKNKQKLSKPTNKTPLNFTACNCLRCVSGSTNSYCLSFPHPQC